MRSIKSKIKRLEKEFQKERQIYVNLIQEEKAKINPDKNIISDLSGEMYCVVDEIYLSQIAVLKTDYYKMLINKYDLFIPFDYGDAKFIEHSVYGTHFTDLGFLECKKIIDSEKNIWFVKISVITGIVGTIIGLLSVIKELL